VWRAELPLAPSARMSFALAFLLGVASGVYVLVRGIECPSDDPNGTQTDEFGCESGHWSIALWSPGLTMFLIVFGPVGYAALRLSISHLAVASLSSVCVGFMASAATVRGLMRWAASAATHERRLEESALQGHIATVTRAEAAGTDAEVAYDIHGRHVTARARNGTATSLAVGSKVAIDRLDGGLLYVEAWTRHEDRI